jgi:hypothetical protein
LFNHTCLPTNPDIDVTIDDPLSDVPPDPIPEPSTDDYDIFQRVVMSYSQFMNQMSIDPSVGTSGTQYESYPASLYHTLGPSTRVSET